MHYSWTREKRSGGRGGKETNRESKKSLISLTPMPDAADIWGCLLQTRNSAREVTKRYCNLKVSMRNQSKSWFFIFFFFFIQTPDGGRKSSHAKLCITHYECTATHHVLFVTSAKECKEGFFVSFERARKVFRCSFHCFLTSRLVSLENLIPCI